MDVLTVFPVLMPGDIDRVSSSTALLFTRKSVFVEGFYSHLFKELPEIQSMFTADFKHQKDMVMQVLATVLKGMSQPQTLDTVIDRLASRHASLGVSHQHLDVAVDALTYSVAHALGQDYSERTVQAWNHLFRGLADLMKARMPDAVS